MLSPDAFCRGHFTMRLPLLPSASARTQRRWLPFGWVAGQIEPSRRRDTLSWSHHSEVAALEPKVQDHLLDLAVAIAKALEPEERERLEKFPQVGILAAGSTRGGVPWSR